MISAQIYTDTILQTNEAFRIDFTNTLVVGETLTLVEIQPESTEVFYPISSATDKTKWFFDWAYATVGTKTITVRMTNSLAEIKTFTKDVVVDTAANEKLFSSDEDLVKFENDIMKWLPKGRGSWNFIHREVQTLVMNDIYKSQIVAEDKSKLTKDQVLDISEVRYWSIFWALELIFSSIYNKQDDVFKEKSEKYSSLKYKNRELSLNNLKLDYNKDAEETNADVKEHRSLTLRR